MNALLIGIFGAVVVAIGLGITLTRQNTSGRMRDASKYTPSPEGMFTPSTTGCAGIAVVLVGLIMVIIAIVGGLTS